MKKLMNCLIWVLVLALALPAALAEASTVSIPDLADISPEITLLDTDDSSNMRIYACADINALVSHIADYASVLMAYYGFGGAGVDEESSSSFSYIYLSEYSGSADIESVYMDECAVPCYIIFALARYDGGYLAIMMTVDGIEIGADMPSGGDGDKSCSSCGGDGVR